MMQIRKLFYRPVFFLFSSIFLLALFVPAAKAEEKILDFHSDVTVNEDSSLLVRETIRVRSSGLSSLQMCLPLPL